MPARRRRGAVPDRPEGGRRRGRPGHRTGRSSPSPPACADEAYEEEDDKKRAPRRFTRLLFKLDSVGWTGDRRRHLFVVPADGSAEAKQITDGDYEDSAPTWTPDGKSIAFSSARGDDWDIELLGDIYVVPADGRRAEAADAGRQQPTTRRLLAGRRKLLACKWAPAGSTSRATRRSRVVDAETGEDRRVLTASLDRQCGPYPEMREPIWDGDSIVFAVEDAGNIHLYRVSPDGGEPELVSGGDDRPLRATTPATASSSAPARPRRTSASSTWATRQLTDVGSDVRRGPRARRAGALHRGLEGRLRGRGVDRPSGRPRGGEALSRPRRTSTAARSPSTATASSTSSRSMRAAATRSSTRTRAARRATPRTGAARSWGRASSGRAGARSTTRT